MSTRSRRLSGAVALGVLVCLVWVWSLPSSSVNAVAERARASAESSTLDPEAIDFAPRSLRDDAGATAGDARVPVSSPEDGASTDASDDELPQVHELLQHVRVVAAEDGRPVAGASVSAIVPTGYPGIDSPRDSTPSALTDASGLARIALQARNAGALEIEAAGFSASFVPAAGGFESAAAPLEVALARCAGLRGVVHGASEGDVVLEVFTLNLVPSALRDSTPPSCWSFRSFRAEVNEQGEFAFGELPSGCRLTPTLELSGAGHHLGAAIELAPGEQRVVEWTVGGRCALRGSVRDRSGARVTPGEVWLVQPAREGAHVLSSFYDTSRIVQRAQLDAAGEFAFRDLAPGAYQVGVPENEGYGVEVECAAGGLSQRVELVDGEAERSIVLEVESGLFITGRVLAPEGALAGDARVSAEALEHHSFRITSAESGSFRIGPLIAGRYRLRAMQAGFADSDEIEVQAGDEHVDLRLIAPASIHVDVSDATSSAGPFVVRLVPAPGSGSSYPWHDESAWSPGGASFVELRPGRYDVVVRSVSGEFGFARGLELRSGASLRTQVRLSRGARVRVRAVDVGRSIRLYSQDTLVSVQWLDAREEGDVRVPSGPIRIQSITSGAPGSRSARVVAEQSLDLAPGELREIELVESHR